MCSKSNQDWWCCHFICRLASVTNHLVLQLTLQEQWRKDQKQTGQQLLWMRYLPQTSQATKPVMTLAGSTKSSVMSIFMGSETERYQLLQQVCRAANCDCLLCSMFEIGSTEPLLYHWSTDSELADSTDLIMTKPVASYQLLLVLFVKCLLILVPILNQNIYMP